MLAALGNLLGFGLGYVYLGRLSYALTFVLAFVLVVLLTGLSGMMLTPATLYLAIFLIVLLPSIAVVHGFVLSRNTPVAARKWYNRYWFYAAWFLAGASLQAVDFERRGEWFGFDHFRVPATSMAPTMLVGDVVTVDTRKAMPQFGDLIVFNVPGSEFKYLKRVVGQPGDRVEIIDNVLHRNGQPISEPYLRQGRLDNQYRNDWPVVLLSAGEYYVLGDNRDNSRDSRHFGIVAQSAVYGVVIHRWFSFYDGSIRWERFPAMLSANDSGSGS